MATACNDRNGLKDLPDTLKIGLPPRQDAELVMQRHRPLFDYISEQLGISYQIKVADSYQAFLDDFKHNRIDLASFGGVTFFRAVNEKGAIPLVVRDSELRMHSYFLVRSDDTAERIQDYQGKRFSFGSKLSTSGHAMPRYFMLRENIEPESFFSSIHYSGSHDKTAYLVRDGIVDIGSSKQTIVDKMFEDGRLSPTQVRILWSTPPFPDDVWALQLGYSEAAQKRLANAFLSLTPDDPEQKKILDSVEAGGFLPGSISDYTEIHEVFNRPDFKKTIVE